MGVRATFDMNRIQRYIDNKRMSFNQTIIKSLAYMGQLAADKARKEGEYNNWTNNLRSSVGYVVVHDGVIKHTNFRKSGNGTLGNGDEGQLVGEILAIDLSKEFKEGFALIVVAGMTYASYVESRGKNVLTSSEHFAEKTWPSIRKQLIENVRRTK